MEVIIYETCKSSIRLLDERIIDNYVVHARRSNGYNHYNDDSKDDHD